MMILCGLLAIADITLIVAYIWREKIYRAVIADLLDRVMARSYGEYVASVKSTSSRPPRRRVLSDEEMAELENQTLTAAGVKR